MNIAAIARTTTSFVLPLGRAIVSNPVISTVALGILSSSYWLKGAEAGVNLYMKCVEAAPKPWGVAACAPLLLVPE